MINIESVTKCEFSLNQESSRGLYHITRIRLLDVLSDSAHDLLGHKDNSSDVWELILDKAIIIVVNFSDFAGSISGYPLSLPEVILKLAYFSLTVGISEFKEAMSHGTFVLTFFDSSIGPEFSTSTMGHAIFLPALVDSTICKDVDISTISSLSTSKNLSYVKPMPSSEYIPTTKSIVGLGHSVVEYAFFSPLLSNYWFVELAK